MGDWFRLMFWTGFNLFVPILICVSLWFGCLFEVRAVAVFPLVTHLPSYECFHCI